VKNTDPPPSTATVAAANFQRPTEDAGPSADWDIIARDFLDIAGRLGS
jgi:hypothetical protein